MNARLHRAILMLLVACGERRVQDADAEPASRPPDAGSETTNDSDGMVVCRSGLTPCDGTCVDLSSSDAHCGACGHACKVPGVYGECRDGECPPALFCGSLEQGVRTCGEVCATHGQECFGGPRDLAWGGCGGAYFLYYDELSLSAEEHCEGNVGSFEAVDATCSTAIDWSIQGGWEDGPPGAVACCCTQEPTS